MLPNRNGTAMGGRMYFCYKKPQWGVGFFAMALAIGNGYKAEAATSSTRPATTSAIDPASRPATQPATANSNNDLTDLSLEDLMNVEVTSVSKKKESVADAPAAVTVISQDDIERSGFSTIPETLRLVPGMDVARINDRSWAISARGLNDQFANQLLVLQDGRSLFSPITGGVYWNTVDYVMQDLDRIEVIRGPGATLWGSNAVNGVINITSKDSRDTQGWLVSSRGSNEDSDLSVRYGGKIADDTTYRVYFKGTYDAGLDDAVTGDTASDSTMYSNRTGFRIDKHPSDSDTFTFQGDLGNDQVRVPAYVPIAAPPFTAEHEYSGTDTTGNVLGRWTHRVSDDSDFSLQLYYDYLAIGEGIDESNTHTIDIDFHDRFSVGAQNAISWGLGYRAARTDVIPTSFDYLSPSTRITSVYSAFVQDTFTITPKHLFLTLGSKFEHNDFTGFQIQPSGRLLWTPDDKHSFWASVSQAESTPTIADEDIRYTAARFQVPNGTGGNTPAEALVLGNRNYQSEEMVAYELGYRMQATSKMSVDVTGFYNNYDRLQSADPGPAQPGSTIIFPQGIDNNIAGDTYGAEIATTLQVTNNWRLAGSYSLLEATFEPVNGSHDITEARSYAGSSPQNQAQIHSYLDITKHLHFNAGVYFTGEISSFGIPSYISTDLNVVWQPREGLDLTVGVMNLIDNHHQEFGITENQGLSDEVPRTFYAQVTFKL
jgi:iron complex outermembrane recepter protein